MSRIGLLMAMFTALTWGGSALAADDAPAGTPTRKIAVFPFTNLGEDAKTDRGAALADTLTTDLTASGAVSAFRETTGSVADAAVAISNAREKGASHAVLGTVQTFGSEVRVSGQVVEVASAKPVGIIRAVGPASGFFAVQDEVSRQVARAFGVDVPPGATVAPAPADASAAGAGLTKSGSGSLILSGSGTSAAPVAPTTSTTQHSDVSAPPAAMPLNLPPPVRSSYWEEYKDLYEPAPMVPANSGSYAAPTPPPPPVTMMGYGGGYYGGGGYVDYAYPPGTVFAQGPLGTTRVEYLGQRGVSIIPPAQKGYSVPAASFWAKPQGPDRVTNPNPAITKYKNPHKPALIGVPQRATPGQLRPGATGNPTPATGGTLNAGAARSK